MPRFTLRDLFWLVLVLALALAWWVDRSRLNAEIDDYDWVVEMVHARPSELREAWRALYD